MSMIQPYPDDNPLLLITAAALIDEDRQVLVQLRPPGRPMAGLWEFPGGKVEVGESAEVALVRELAEELDIVVDAKDLTPYTFACEPLGERQLLLLLYVCHAWQGQPRPLVAAELRWCRLAELEELDMPPADRPLVRQLRHIL